jgi:hypothetical protein
LLGVLSFSALALTLAGRSYYYSARAASRPAHLRASTMDADLLARTRIFSTMKSFRISASILTLAALSLLAACGGGGGGGGTPPVGGGGGSTPTPAPHHTATPTPVPVNSPTPTPASGVQVSAYTEQAEIGPQVNPPSPGPSITEAWYTSGITASWTNHAGDTTAGANASNSFPAMDGMSCTATLEPAASTATYSVHAFVGIYNNGTQLTLPQAIGMNTPVEPTVSGHPNDNYEVESQACEYNIHTHDYSGLVHIEDVNAAQTKSTTSPLSYTPTLKSLLDIWGVQLSSNSLTIPGETTLTGPVAVYFGNQGTNVGPKGGFLTDTYQKAAATDGSDVPLAWHTTVWIVIGSMPSQPTSDVGLPKIEWRIQY